MRGPALSRREYLILGASTIFCLGAWLLPRSKPTAVLGRLDYLQFVLALLATGLLASVVLVLVLPAARRRRAGFRTASVWLGAAVAVLAWEGTAFLLPPRHVMDNPFYIFDGQGVNASDELPFERPAHLHWEGPSRGDLAIINEDTDPYATRVTYVTDHEGFRNSRDLTQADLLFLGDSFTEAGNMAEDSTFVQRTAAELGQTARNLGRAGYTGPSELIVLRKYGLKCRPRIAVWQISEANDLIEAVLFEKWVAAGRPRYSSLNAPPLGRTDAWKQYSPTWRLFCCIRTPRSWPLRGTFQDSGGRVYEIRFMELPSDKQSPVDHLGWPILAESLREGARLLREEKIPLVVLLIPMKARGLGPGIRLRPALQAEVGPDWDLPESVTLAAHLRKLCAELDVPFVDATPPLRAAAASGNLVYLPLDTHLSAEGHRVVSLTLVEALRTVGK